MQHPSAAVVGGCVCAPGSSGTLTTRPVFAGATRAALVRFGERVANLGQRLALVTMPLELLYEASAVSVTELDRDDARLQVEDVERVIAEVVARGEVERHVA